MNWFTQLIDGFKGLKGGIFYGLTESPMVLDDNDLIIEGYLKNVIGYRCINEIANAASNLEIEAYQGDKVLDNHEILQLLQKPNEFIGYRQFIKNIIQSYLIQEAYIEALKDGSGKIQQFYTLPSNKIECKNTRNSDYSPESYDYQNNGLKKIYKPEQGRFIANDEYKSELLRLWDSSPFNKFEAYSPLQACVSSILNFNKAQSWNYSLLCNGGSPSAIFSTEQTLNENERAKLKEAVEEKYSNYKERGKPFVLFGGLKPDKLGFSPADMHFKDLLDSMGKLVCIGFNVPLPMVFDDASTYNNYETAKAHFYSDTVIPLTSRILDLLSDALEVQYKGVRVRVNEEAIAALTGQRNEKIDSMVKLVNAGIISEAQAAEELGYEYDESQVIEDNLNLINQNAQSQSNSENTNSKR